MVLDALSVRGCAVFLAAVPLAVSLAGTSASDPEPEARIERICMLEPISVSSGVSVAAHDPSQPLDPLELEAVLEQGYASTQPCWQAAHERGVARAKVATTITIDTRGNVTAVDVGADGELGACLMDAVGAWQFPASSTPTTFTFKLASS